MWIHPGTDVVSPGTTGVVVMTADAVVEQVPNIQRELTSRFGAKLP
jgi:hypothetical protein